MTVKLKQSIFENDREKIRKKKRLEAWEILLLILGSPIWLSLLISVLAIILSIYIVLWSVVISLWTVFVSVLCSVFVGIIVGIGFAFSNSSIVGFFMVGSGIVCSGLSIFLFFGCKFITKALLIFTKNIISWLKKKSLRGGCNE